MSKLRIDTGSIGYTSDFLRQQGGKELNSSANNGESLRGRITDVNQNTVLIQTNTGEQLSATTMLPLENFINQEMTFTLSVGENGELILLPDMDKNKEESLKQLKIQDTLAKLGKEVSNNNKEIIKEMMDSSIPITKENFEQVKEMKFALELLKSDDFAVELQVNESSQDIMSVLKDIQNKKDFNIAQKTDSPLIGKDVSLKDLLLLKNLDVKVSVDNIRAFTQLMKNIEDKKTDILGTNDVIENLANFTDVELNESISYVKADNSNVKNQFKDVNILLENAENLSIEDMEELNRQFKDVVFDDFDKEVLAKEDIKEQKLPKKVDLGEIEEILRDVQKKSLKKIAGDNNDARDKLKIDYQQLKDEVRLASKMSQGSEEISKAIENRISSKLDILTNMMDKYNYNIIPFKTENDYENILQYYVKKEKKSLKKQDDINVGLSLDTKNNGNVKAMVNYKQNNNLKLEFFTDDKKVKSLFENNMTSLTSILKKLGFAGVDVSVKVKKSSDTLIQDAFYNEDLSKSVEFYV